MRGSNVREAEVHVPSYVLGREAILRASCLGDSIRRNGFDIEENERKPKIQRILRHLQISEAANPALLRLVVDRPTCRRFLRPPLAFLGDL